MRDLSWWKKACIVFVICAATEIASPAQTFTTLVNFDGTNGGLPQYMSLIQGIDGNLYGTTYGGGAGGTVFRMTLGGKLTTVYSFCAQVNCTDGANPFAGLVLGTDGNFYGTTANDATGNGTVFKLTQSGKLTTLYTFCARTNCTDGTQPFAGLVQGSDGNFYGTTFGGGHVECNCGTAFKITPRGKLTTLFRFRPSSGDYPVAPLVQGAEGNLYGTTSEGGYPYAGGTVFQISPGNQFSVLYTFCSLKDCADGNAPQAPVIQATDGNFYGTTQRGGVEQIECTLGCGTVFELTPEDALTTLHTFCPQTGCADGYYPYGGLIQATDGNFYGTTYQGGAQNFGTVFKISMGLSPFVSFIRNPAKAGQEFGILGQGLTGTTSVSLNGTPATYTVVYDTFIRATVPAGATTGYVTVTTPSGTLTSNKPFHVIP